VINLATRISSDDFETQVLLSETPVLTEFYSDSCIPCKRMSPLLSQIESQYGDSLKVVKVNINFDAELAKEYGVLSVPTVVFFDKGEVRSSFTSFLFPATVITIILFPFILMYQ